MWDPGLSLYPGRALPPPDSEGDLATPRTLARIFQPRGSYWSGLRGSGSEKAAGSVGIKVLKWRLRDRGARCRRSGVVAGRALGVHRPRLGRRMSVSEEVLHTVAPWSMGRVGNSTSLCYVHVSRYWNPKTWSPRNGAEGLRYAPCEQMFRGS